MSHVYTVNFTPTAETVAMDLCELVAADDRPIRILGFRVFQTSEVGDAQDEQILVQWVRGNTTSGSGGAAAATLATGKMGHEPTSGFTQEVGNTTAASAGTAVVCYSSGWNVRAPLEVTLTEKQQFGTDQGLGFLVLRLGAPVDSVTMGCSVDVEELP